MGSLRLGVGVILVGLVLAAPAAAQRDACRQKVEAELQRYGIDLAEMSNVYWSQDRFSEDGGRQGRVSGYRFTGRPKNCTSGSVVLEMGPGCGVNNTYTRGGCSLPGR